MAGSDAEPKLPRGLSRSAVAKIELPKGGGALRGIGEKFSVNAVNGTVSFALPLPLSPGRSGFGPQLELAYDSGRGNGPFGIGWHLSLPAITRKTDKGLPQYRDWDMSDIFLLAGAEDLVPALKDGPAGTKTFDERVRDGYTVRRYRPRIEGAFLRIERWARLSDGDVHWRTLTRENLLSIYGKDANSRIADSHDPNRIFSWLIAETRDEKGNGIVYEYKSEDATGVDLSRVSERNRGRADDPRRTVQRYLKRVRYGNRVPLLDGNGNRLFVLSAVDIAGAGWAFDLVFDYGEHAAAAPRPLEEGPWLCRNDPFSVHRAAFEVRSYRLCQRILMFHQFSAEDGVGVDCFVRSLDLAYRNSRGDADDARRGNALGSLLASATQRGYVRNGATYRESALPPLEFEYSEATIQEDVSYLDADSLTGLPAGLDPRDHAWIDLDGEGLSGILTEQADGWYYKRNRGGGIFGPPEPLARKPSTVQLSRHRQLWLDVDGDGQVDLVDFDPPTPGYLRRNGDKFDPFRPFRHLPKIDWHDRNLRIVDLDGDGLADVLITEQDVFTWYPSEGESGYGPARTVNTPDDEERGPRLVLDDGAQSIFLADMSGDGLTDLVRVRNGEVCYWPNLGYGRFGAKVTMDASPWFDRIEQFDTKRIRLADIDGTGCADVVYLGGNGVTLYFNQAGNAWSTPRRLSRFPPIDNVAGVSIVDLLGNGTACLVWSSPLPADAPAPLRYIDLAGGQKSNLLVRSVNNLGAETVVQYTPSTSFYLADRAAGQPWITRPALCRACGVACRDAGPRQPQSLRLALCLSSRPLRRRRTGIPRLRHGRAVRHRGVGRAQRRRGFSGRNQHRCGVLCPDSLHQDLVSHRPHSSVATASRASSPRSTIVKAIRRREAACSMRPASRLHCCPIRLLPDGSTADEMREALRALKGSMLRSEVYALDGTSAADRPYRVVERQLRDRAPAELRAKSACGVPSTSARVDHVSL